MPAAEVDVGPTVVRGLLAGQMPDLAHLPLARVATGWDNEVYRLGHDWAVRVPRRAMGAALTEHEHRWLPELAARLPLPIPVPVRQGRPQGDYPWRWSVCPWLAGEPAASVAPEDPDETAEVLGAFVSALHTPAPADAPSNPYRGGPLTDRDGPTRDRIRQLAGLWPEAVLRGAWDDAMAEPPWDGPRVWIHGDLHPANVLVKDGRLAAVIDFGDLSGGDRATDLSAAWMLLPASARARFRLRAGAVWPVDDATWKRAWAWALMLGITFVANSADHPVVAAIGRRTLRAALADERP